MSTWIDKQQNLVTTSPSFSLTALACGNSDCECAEGYRDNFQTKFRNAFLSFNIGLLIQ